MRRHTRWMRLGSRENERMRLRDAMTLLAPADVVALGATTWADLGSGDGTFTRALANVLAPGSVIHAMDVDGAALRGLATPVAESGADAAAVANSHPDAHGGVRAGAGVRIETHRGDFTRQPWPFDRVDGILMANSLHYVRDQTAFIRACATQMTARGRFLIVEYDLDLAAASRWVPYPLNRANLSNVFATAGYTSMTVLGSRPSVYRRGELYAALIEP